MSDTLTRTIKIAAVVLALYVLAYFALARPGITLEAGGRWASCPDYRGVPEAPFRPLHYWDRKFLRPRLWAGTVPLAEQLRAFEAAQSLLK